MNTAEENNKYYQGLTFSGSGNRGEYGTHFLPESLHAQMLK